MLYLRGAVFRLLRLFRRILFRIDKRAVRRRRSVDGFFEYFIVPVRWLIFLAGIILCTGAAVFYTANGIFYLKLLRKPNAGTGVSALFTCAFAADIIFGLIAGFVCVIWIAHGFDRRETAVCVLLGVLPFVVIAFDLICNRLSAKTINSRSA